MMYRLNMSHDALFIASFCHCVSCKDFIVYFVERLSVLVAAGPFTTTDSIMYEPLADLIKAIIRDQPDVAVLVSKY